MSVGFFGEPPAGLCSEICQVFKEPGVEQIVLYVLEGGFDFSLGLSCAAHNRPTVIVGDESDEGGVVDGAGGFPAKKDCFFPVIEPLPGDSAEVFEGIQMAADQGEEIAMLSKIDVLSSGESQDV